MRKELGQRLKQIRASRLQPDMAIELGVAPRTYASYERGESEMGVEPLARLVSAGWNANWLLTGEGPERVEQLVGGGPESASLQGSQALRQADLIIAVQLAQEALEGRTLEPNDYGQLVSLIYDALVHGLPSAQVLALARPAARGLTKGVDDGRAVVGGSG